MEKCQSGQSKAWPTSTEAETHPAASTIRSSIPERAKKISVLIADDHPVFRLGLAAILNSENDIEIVAEAADGEEVCQLYDQHSPDVLMLDLRMPKKRRAANSHRIDVAASFQTADRGDDFL